LEREESLLTDFFYGNVQKGLAVVMRKVKSQQSFLEQAQKLKWIEKLLNHLAGTDCDKEDAGQWIAHYIGKKHDASFTLACEALGTPIVQMLDEPSAEVMSSK
jgi:hypothetical protein